ncbi:MAG: hypothetical protein ACR2KT_06095 [Methylocella sp.]
MSSFEPSERAYEGEVGEEVSGRLFVACRDASEMFDDIEEFFDQIARAGENEIASALDLAV